MPLRLPARVGGRDPLEKENSSCRVRPWETAPIISILLDQPCAGLAHACLAFRELVSTREHAVKGQKCTVAK